MRKKRHGAERMQSCAEFLAPDRSVVFADPHAPFANKATELRLEIGCGKGGFAVKSAAKNPDAVFYAMERVGNVMVNALEKAEANREACIGNLRFILGRAEELEEYFPPHCLSVIYLNFSDPWPKKGHHRRRLTAPEKLESYRRLLVPGGKILQKTDNRELFDYSLAALEAADFRIAFATDDLQASARAAHNVMTEYEEGFVSAGKTICFLEAVCGESSNTID